MHFLVLLLLILLGAGAFFLFAWLFRKRNLRVTRVLAIIGGTVSLILLFVWITERSGWRQEGQFTQLRQGIFDREYRFYLDQSDELELPLLLHSIASSGFYRMARQNSTLQPQVEADLLTMAQWVSDRDRFPQWKPANRRGWDQQLFFLTHASIILGHYQLLSLDERFAELWRATSQHLATSIQRSRYKHLASYPRDAALRPYDHGAAIYALTLFDTYYAETTATSINSEWGKYVAKELTWSSSNFPCAGFTQTNRCRLTPTATSTAYLIAYLGEARSSLARDYWREFRFFFKRTIVGLSAHSMITPGTDEIPEFCQDNVRPFPYCGAFQNELSFWAAAARGDWLSYHQYYNGLFFRDLFNPPLSLNQIPMTGRTEAMLRQAISLAAYR